jgi:hypothetical protein
MRQPDSKALVLQSVRNYERDWRAGMLWGYTQTDVTRADGAQEVDVSEVIPLEGTPYERLILRNGKPLTAAEKSKEDRKYEKAARERKNESPAKRAARIEKYESERSFLKDLPNAYDFAPMGEETVNGRPAWILGVAPRANFVPTTPRGGMLKHIKGRLWIDKRDLQWVKAEARVIDPISIGWILARVDQGAKIELNMERVADGLWMPARIDIDGTVRVMLVHNKALDEHVTFTGYHPYGPANGMAQREGR